MNQQINLYQPVFRGDRRLFSASRMAVAAGAFVAALLLIYGYGVYKVDKLEELLTQEKAREAAGLKRLGGYGSSAMSPAETARMEEDIARAQSLLRKRRKLLAALQGGELGSTQGFSERLTGFASRTMTGIWLTQIRLTGASGMRLEGVALDPEQVPRYLQGLAEVTAFEGTLFNRLEIQEQDGSRSRVTFVLSGEEDTEDARANRRANRVAKN